MQHSMDGFANVSVKHVRSSCQNQGSVLRTLVVSGLVCFDSQFAALELIPGCTTVPVSDDDTMHIGDRSENHHLCWAKVRDLE